MQQRASRRRCRQQQQQRSSQAEWRECGWGDASRLAEHVQRSLGDGCRRVGVRGSQQLSSFRAWFAQQAPGDEEPESLRF